MAESGRIVAATHEKLERSAKPGMTTSDLDEIAFDTIKSLGGEPNFLHYNGFPASVCISVNDEVVHGIPGARTLELGDLVSFDCGALTYHGGKPWHADGAITTIVGDDGSQDSTAALEQKIGPQTLRERRELISMTRDAMWAGVAAMAKKRRVGDIGAAIEDSVEQATDTVEWAPQLVEGYTGHGIGNSLHESPTVFNYRVGRRGPRIKDGMVLCIEPMITVGDAATRVKRDEWTVVTKAGTDAAHFEQTVARVGRTVAVLTAVDGGVEALKKYGVTPAVIGS